VRLYSGFFRAPTKCFRYRTKLTTRRGLAWCKENTHFTAISANATKGGS